MPGRWKVARDGRAAEEGMAVMDEATRKLVETMTARSAPFETYTEDEARAVVAWVNAPEEDELKWAAATKRMLGLGITPQRAADIWADLTATGQVVRLCEEHAAREAAEA